MARKLARICWFRTIQTIAKRCAPVRKEYASDIIKIVLGQLSRTTRIWHAHADFARLRKHMSPLPDAGKQKKTCL